MGNIENILLEKYENTQEIDISKIICNICKINNKGHTFNNNFFVCNTCKENICPLCKSKHDKEHKIINYEQKDYICDMHNELYIKYCTTCKKIYVYHVIICIRNILLLIMKKRILNVISIMKYI